MAQRITKRHVTMRHPKLSDARSKKAGSPVDVTVKVRPDQVPIHEKSGWELVETAAAAKPAGDAKPDTGKKGS